MTVAITLPPSPPPTREDPSNFAVRADAHHAWLVPAVMQMNNQNAENNSINANVNAKRDELIAAGLQNSAANAVTATTQATAALTHANNSATSASQASASATSAAASATSAGTAATAAANTLISAVTQRPALRPSLSVDWTLKPTAAALTAAGWTVSRAGEMTYFGPVPVKVAENLFVRSTDFGATIWVKDYASVTAVTDESGLAGVALTASATYGYHSLYQTATAANLGIQTYRVRMLLKAVGYTKVCIGDLASGRAAACFDLSAGTLLNTSSGATAALPGGVSGSAGAGYISSSITPHELGGGLYWCELVMTSVAAGTAWTPSVSGYPASGATIDRYGAKYTGDGTSGIEVYAAQLQHNFDGDYVQTTDVPITQYASPLLTAAANELAYQHNSRGECVGLLQYPADTNLILQSQNQGTGWSGLGLDVAATKRLWAGSAPFWRVAKTDTNNSRALTQYCNITGASAGAKYTVTVALLGDRWSSTTTAQVGVCGAVNGLWGAGADATAVIISGPGTLTGTNLCYVSGLSYDTPTLIRITRTFPLAETQTGVFIYPGGSGSTTLGAAVLATRVHLSASSRYMPYIPTTTAAVTRGAQSISLGGSAFAAVNNPVEGTLLVRASVEDLVFGDGRAAIRTGFSGLSSYSVSIQTQGGSPANASVLATTSTAGVLQASPAIGAWSATPLTAAFSYTTNNSQLGVGGALSATDTSGSVPVVNQLAGPTWAGLIQRTELYPCAMTSAELSAITTPGVLV